MVVVNESNQAQQAGQRLDAAGDSERNAGRPCGIRSPKYHTQTPATRAKMPLFHPSPTIQPAVILSPPLSPCLPPYTLTSHFVSFQMEGEGGRLQPRSCHGALIPQQLFFSFLVFFFLPFSLKMYSVVFFSLFFFFREKYYCSSLPSVCNLLIIPRLSDADHSVVVSGDD